MRGFSAAASVFSVRKRRDSNVRLLRRTAQAVSRNKRAKALVAAYAVPAESKR